MECFKIELYLTLKPGIWLRVWPKCPPWWHYFEEGSLSFTLVNQALWCGPASLINLSPAACLHVHEMLVLMGQHLKQFLPKGQHLGRLMPWLPSPTPTQLPGRLCKETKKLGFPLVWRSLKVLSLFSSSWFQVSVWEKLAHQNRTSPSRLTDKNQSLHAEYFLTSDSYCFQR